MTKRLMVFWFDKEASAVFDGGLLICLSAVDLFVLLKPVSLD